MSQTLFIIKPNAVKKNKIGTIIKMFEDGGLVVKALKMLHLDEEQAKEFYEVHSKRDFYQSLVNFMCSGNVVVGVLEGDDAVSRCRKIMGATDPAKAEPGTIRALMGDNIQENAVHGSDSDENAIREIKFFFPDFKFQG